MPIKTIDQFLSDNDGDPVKALNAIHADLKQFDGDNYALRETKRTLQAQLPKEGQVVTDTATVEALAKYQGYGTPDEIAATRAELATMKRGALIGRIATIAGFKTGVLQRLDGMQSQQWGLRIAGEEAQMKQAGKLQKFDEYAADTLKLWLPSLAVESTNKPAWIGQGSGNPPSDKKTQEQIKEQKAKQTGSLF